jgi:hypothetical protein
MSKAEGLILNSIVLVETGFCIPQRFIQEVSYLLPKNLGS